MRKPIIEEAIEEDRINPAVWERGIARPWLERYVKDDPDTVNFPLSWKVPARKRAA